MTEQPQEFNDHVTSASSELSRVVASADKHIRENPRNL